MEGTCEKCGKPLGSHRVTILNPKPRRVLHLDCYLKECEEADIKDNNPADVYPDYWPP